MWPRPKPLAQAIGTLTAAEGTLRQSQAEYARAVGQPPGRLLLPRERPTLPATREEAQTLAADNNYSVISANFSELAARQYRRGARPAAAADFDRRHSRAR